MSDNFKLSGTRALVTGGSKGIGRAVAEEFLNLGAIVTITARGEGEVQAAVKSWQQKGFEAHGVTADMASSEGREAAIKFAVEKMGGLDSLINNVGTNNRKRALDYTIEEYEQSCWLQILHQRSRCVE